MKKLKLFKLLALFVFAITVNPAEAQNSFSFNCEKDTLFNCAISCITLHTTIPDIHASSSTYVVNQTSSNGCFRSYVDPAVPGLRTNIKGDDVYSRTLDITFPFSFFGSTYTKLVASTNGYLSFDTSVVNTFSHFGILNRNDSLTTNLGTPQDLPSVLYDKALIMGPYHDLDVKSSVSPTQIKYDIIGTSPYRKWIISYYNVPLYSTACLNLKTNTHQIVLYETLGIVEVFIYDKEICLNWNDGRAMIGMQDFNKSSAIMAPGRQASSAPWGSKGMNESWRFVPASGPSLFKRVELYDQSGALITTGTTSSIANNLLDVNFKNVCTPNLGETYIVKAFYNNPNGSIPEIVSTDTIIVSKGDAIKAIVRNTNCSGTDGQINIQYPVGSSYEYSLDGITWQSSNVFTVTDDKYTIRARTVGSNCISTKDVIVEKYSLDANIQKVFNACPGPVTASIQIMPVHGSAPYLYSLNGGVFQTGNIYNNLSEGNYSLIIKDASGCSYTTQVDINRVNLASTIVTNTTCGKGTGSILITPNFGRPPYTYSINGGGNQTSNIFNNLTEGSYDIIIKDATSCSYTFRVTVNANNSLTANLDIIKPDCLGNANGSVIVHPSSGNVPYQFALDSNSFTSDSIFNNLSARDYILHVKDSLGCIKDIVITLSQPNLFEISGITTYASTCFTSDGIIFIKANGGTTPYLYSIDSAKTFYLTNTFPADAGAHPIVVKDSKGCISNGVAIVQAIDNSIKVDVGPDKTICFGNSTNLNSYTNLKAISFNWSPSSGLNDSTIANPIASPLDTTTYILTAKTVVCEGSDTITINVLHKPIANAGKDTTICNKSYAILKGSATNISGGVKYLWLPSAGLDSPTSSTTIARPITTGAHNYRLQVSDTYGCNFKVYDDVKITMNETLVANAGNDTVASIGVPHQLFGSGGIYYLWSPSNVLDDPLAQNPIASLQNDTRFNLVVKDTLGCIGIGTVLIKVYKGVTYYIPNAFTPNGDGINDVFRAIAPGIQTNYFRIFNRWGRLMFQTNNTSNGWDGTYLGVPQPTAVYVWIIKGLKVSGEIVELKGTVTLIR